ncbi:MAG: squalene/phytoene synthase family protein [Chloroflexota bacterium]|nr:squalene/phytoene synthase family protein [Chloroflexota bacterium]
MEADAVHVHATDDVQRARRNENLMPPESVRIAPHSVRAARLPVRGMLLPRRHRPTLAALAAFYRETRTLGTPTPAHGARLDAWETEVNRVWDGAAMYHPVLSPLAARDLPREPLLALLAAQRERQRTPCYETYDDLLGFCARAANPLGRLVLAILGYMDSERIEHSDALSTAVQLTAFWRDIARDYTRGRIYIPREDMHLFGVADDDLARAIAHHRADTNIRAMVAFEIERALEVLHHGAPLVTMLRGRARLDCALVISDARAMLAAIVRQGYDPFVTRPQLSRTARAGTLFGAVRSISEETLHSR